MKKKPMKSIFKIGMWKALAFLTVAIFIISCFTDCRPVEPVLPVKAVITIQPSENVTETSATLVALVTPNMDPTTITFRYMVAGKGGRKSVSVTETYSGTDPKKVTYIVNGLVAGAIYNVDAVATNAAGTVTSTLGVFTTIGYVKATVAITAISEAKLDSAIIYFVSVPNQSNTTISLEYQIENSTWKSKEMGTNFSGTDSIKLSWALTGLQANTKYNVRVKSINKAGEVISSTLQFRTYAVKDWDGNFYHLVTIGTQTWLKENFKGTHYANGDPIANVTDATEWGKLSDGAYCYYNNNPKIGEEYGGLYNWYVGADPRGLIVGWHVPTDNEFETLNTYLGGWAYSGLHIMEAGNAHWDNVKGVVTNSSGFTALPNGARSIINKSTVFTFFELRALATFWESDTWVYKDETAGHSTYITSGNCSFITYSIFPKNNGCSLRLVKN